MRIDGKKYVMQDGDVVELRHGKAVRRTGNGNGNGNGTISTSADVAFTFSGAQGAYSLGVYEKTLPGTVLTDGSDTDAVEAACTSP